MSAYQIITIILSGLSSGISLSPLCKMPAGLANLPHKIKYIAVLIAGFMLISFALKSVASLSVMVLSGCLFAAVWPRVQWWWKNRK